MRNNWQEKPKGLELVAVKLFTFIFLLMVLFSAQSQDSTSTTASVPNKDLEVAMGIDVIEKLDFDYNPRLTIGNESLLKLTMFPQKREISFKGLKPGRTNVTIRDSLGDVRLQYTVVITATGKSNTVSELRELIGDIEGIEIGIRGGKVFVGGEIVVPDDIGRIAAILPSYPDVLTLIELSPQTQRIIAKKMTDELAKNNLKDVTARVVNKVYWLEGVVSNKDKKALAVTIAKAYLPPKIMSLAQGSARFAQPQADDIIDFIAINEKKEPQPSPKMIKITSQFVELARNYTKVFAFKWAPLMGEDNSQITFGQTPTGNVVGRQTDGSLSATISNLFPKLNSAKSAGYARTIQSGMVIVRDGFEQGGSITKNTTIPYEIGNGELARAASATVGLTLDVKPKILEQEKIELGISLSVNLSVPTGGTVPITTENKVNTNIILKSKESAAIGGVVQNSSTTDYDKTDPAPVQATAGEVPASPLFRLLRSKNYTTSKSQYVIFVTPEIIESASAGTDEIKKKFRRRE